MKKIFLCFCIIFLSGCSVTNFNTMNFEEIVDSSIENNNMKSNIYRKGYKYYLPSEFQVKKDDDYIQTLISKNNVYYLNIDVVSYHYKNDITSFHGFDDYVYYEFENDEEKGYLKILENNGKFFIELCYNYAIMEVEVEENELRYAISRSIAILDSIEYNDLVIEKYITDNNIDSNETIYKIPEPENKDDSKNVLEYIGSDEEVEDE